MAGHRENQCLCADDAAHMALFHAQDMVETELAPALLHEKIVGEELKEEGKDQNNNRAHMEEHGEGVAPHHGAHARVVGQGRDDVEHGLHDHTGEDIGGIVALVFPEALQGKAGEISLTHGCRLPFAAPSGRR